MHGMRRRPLLIAAIALALGTTFAEAQTSSPPRSVWDSAYTAAQATNGETAFRYGCANCHATVQFTGPSFLGAWEGGTAYELVELIKNQMPFDNPASLPREQYRDIRAYLFKLNGFPAGNRPLPDQPDELKQIRIHAKPESE